MLSIVKEFYSNMLRQDQHKIMVRNVQVSLDPRVINAFYNLPSDIDCEHSKMVEYIIDKKWSEVLKTLTVKGSLWLDEEGRVMNRIDLKPVAKVWVKFLKSGLIPTTHTTIISHERLILLYTILKYLRIDVGKVKERKIRECAMKKHKTVVLLFPSLITGICLVSGVKISVRDESIKNEEALTVRTVEIIAGKTTAAITQNMLL